MMINVALQEDRIVEGCIAHLANKLDLSENIVQKIHDFQWEEIKRSTEEYKTVKVSKFFNLLLRENKVNIHIKKLKKEQVKLLAYYETSSEYKKWLTSNRIGQIDKEIELLKKQSAKCKSK